MKRTGLTLIGGMLLLLGSCTHKDASSPPTRMPASTPKPATQPATQPATLTMAMVQSLRVSPAKNRGEMQRRMRMALVVGYGLPRDLPARIRQMNIQEQARELAMLLTDGADYHGADASSWKNFRPGEPEDLQFSCVPSIDFREELWHDLLRCNVGDVPAIAAHVLWSGHSRRYAREVLDCISDAGKDSAAWKEVRRLTNDTFTPEKIMGEINIGDKGWGFWLASSKPDPRFVQAIMAFHAISPSGYTTYALGASGDARALAPLLDQLRSGDYMMSGYAAQALGLLGNPAAEAPLIEGLESRGVWAQAHSCWALGRIGTQKAIPCLEELAKPHLSGAIDVAGAAGDALKQIKDRLSPSPEHNLPPDK